MDMINTLALELEVKPWQVEAAVKLIDEGCTIPFIARYRKEATGTLNDEVLRKLYERLNYLRGLEERKEQVIATIREQEKLTPELEKQIREAATLVAVEDLYRPYKPKRRTRAAIAREKGLEPLADLILLQMTKRPLEEDAKTFLSEEKGVETVEEALAGACDILAERISDRADYRARIRDMTVKEGLLTAQARDEKEKSVYETYYQYQEPVAKAAGHRILALNRGEKEKFLTVRLEAPEEKILAWLERQIVTRDNPYTGPLLKETAADSYRRLIAPAIEREIRSQLTERAEEGAIQVFGKNLKQLLMQPPHPGTGGAGLGSGFPHRLQAGGGGRHGKGAGHCRDLSYGPHHSRQTGGGPSNPEKTDSEVWNYAFFCGQRNGLPGIGAVYCGSASEHTGESTVCDCK